MLQLSFCLYWLLHTTDPSEYYLNYINPNIYVRGPQAPAYYRVVTCLEPDHTSGWPVQVRVCLCVQLDLCKQWAGTHMHGLTCTSGGPTCTRTTQFAQAAVQFPSPHSARLPSHKGSGLLFYVASTTYLFCLCSAMTVKWHTLPFDRNGQGTQMTNVEDGK